MDLNLKIKYPLEPKKNLIFLTNVAHHTYYWFLAEYKSSLNLVGSHKF